ncbi:BTB/POZ domain-containing protein 1-like [Ostrinia furnacalis]|uniref:BTB/POZ domain-containing protein 1-like n=1 Tax=Ostrinia furnacalis TaxID=93504 RepID=UPI0010397E88|nr:BTB/POZ domain-containing protein 1-like [Ostrinia furnacalis]
MGFNKVNNELTQTNLYDRVKKLLVSYEWSDCCFAVSGKKIKAHKLILCISSPVFEAMFYGPLSSDKEVVITDIEPEIFQQLLNYIYTDKVEISSIEEALELLYASRKYILDHLTDMCIAYIQTNICVDNVIQVLNYPDYDKQLTSCALKLFCEHARYLFRENIDMISSSCMEIILKSDQMNMKEVELIKNVFKWTKHYCQQNEIPETFENRHEVLFKNGLFELLRFNLLSFEELEEITNNVNNILLPKDLNYIKKSLLLECENNERRSLHKHKYLPRSPLKLQWYLCYRSPLRPVAPLNIDLTNYIKHSRIKANKSIFINSLCIPARTPPNLAFYNDNVPKTYTELLSVSIVSVSDNKILQSKKFTSTVKYDSSVEIELSEPCFIKKNMWYNIQFMWPQNQFQPHSYVVEVRDRISYGYKTLTIEFDDLSNGTPVGSFLEGLKFCF